eukprot:192540-Hanusia_phi.AAC.2
METIFFLLLTCPPVNVHQSGTPRHPEGTLMLRNLSLNCDLWCRILQKFEQKLKLCLWASTGERSTRPLDAVFVLTCAGTDLECSQILSLPFRGPSPLLSSFPST